MKITDIEPVVVHVNHRGDWVFVLVHTDAGITGLGEASHSGNDTLLLATLEAWKPLLAGTPAMQIGLLETIGLDWRLADEYVERLKTVTAEQVRQVARIGLVVAVLDAGILRYRACMREADIEPRVHQPIDQPIPVVG